jgi:toxin-antitoxin system PIN domain toxin
MIIPDVNLLVYAYDERSKFHAPAKSWWEDCLKAQETIGLPWAVSLGFLRMTTNRRLFPNPMSVSTATAIVRSWIDRQEVLVLNPGPRHADIVLGYLNELGTAGNLTSDAHLAALAHEFQAILHSNDADFARFSGLRWKNPLK